jgi:hypothetical protein
MLITARRHVARIMFIVMLATFASPTLGWGMVAAHDQLSHGLIDAHAGEVHDDHPHDGHDSDDQHQDPHSSIGHLFTHMPVGLFNITSLTFQPQAQPETAFLRQSVRAVALEPPLRPPRASLSC